MKPVTTVSALCAGLCLAFGALAQSAQQGTTPPPTSATPPATTAADQANTPPAAQGRADATTDRSAAAKGESKLARADRDFLQQAAQNGHAEMEASKLAQQKATHADVKAFASKMIEDHGKAHEELAKLASAKGVSLPDEPSIAQRAKLKMLEAADGEKFDKRYADSFGVKAHEDTVKMFREASTKAQDPDVKAFAQQKLAALEQHLTLAKSMHAAVEPSAAGKRDRTAERSATGETTTGSAARSDKPAGKTDKADKDKKY